jgi:hypothetical protein
MKFSAFNFQFTTSYQLSAVSCKLLCAKLLKIDNCKLLIASGGGV